MAFSIGYFSLELLLDLWRFFTAVHRLHWTDFIIRYIRILREFQQIFNDFIAEKKKKIEIERKNSETKMFESNNRWIDE